MTAITLNRAGPLTTLLTHQGGPVLPDPIPPGQIPEDVWRAYVVLTAEAIRREIAHLEKHPPEAFAELNRTDPVYAERWRNELNGMRTIEMLVQDFAAQVLAQLYPFCHRYPAPADAPTEQAAPAPAEGSGGVVDEQ